VKPVRRFVHKLRFRYVPLGPRPATARKAGGDDKAPFNPGGGEQRCDRECRNCSVSKTLAMPAPSNISHRHTAAFVKVLNKPLPAPYIEDPYETKQLLAKKEFQVQFSGSS
jgi:hypothetical protein